MTWEERLRAMQDDLKWLLTECIKADEMECAQSAVAATLRISDLNNTLHAHSLNDADWDRNAVEPSPVLDHRFIPEGMDPGICQKCGATRASHRDTREGIVFAEKAAESSPDQLVGALQDRVHQDLGRVRAGRSVKASDEHVHEWHPLPRGVNFCVTCDAVFKPLFGVDLAPGESRSGWMCTKHGVINGPDCDKCKQGSEEPKHGV